MTAKLSAIFLAALLSTVAGAQTWSRAYDNGLTAARAGKWADAREAFQQAAAGRPDDRSAPTVLPGPATERKLWRDGAPYSPNFLSAYSLYRQALTSSDDIEASRSLRTASTELETLVTKDQASAETFFFLDVIYTKLGDAEKRKASADRLTKLGHKPDFKVDAEVLAPEEVAAIQARTSNTTVVPGGGGTSTAPIVKPGGAITATGTAVPLATKFALVIGQSQGRLSTLPFGASDAQRVKDALVSFAGYPVENVELVQNASASQIGSAAKTLAARAGNNATVLIYFVGGGVNLAGRDYLAGVDTESASDTATMISKVDLFAPFIEKGSRLFAFFEVSRKLDSAGNYFGREGITSGQVSQVQSTRPGDNVLLTFKDNQPVGTFTNAFVQILSELRVNQVPIFEFTWQVVNAMRRGDSGSTGGGGQPCTLPQLTGLAADAKF